METNLRETSQSNPLIGPIASPWHTAVILIAILALAYRGYLQAAAQRAIIHPDRIKMYERTILLEWLTLAVVLAGLWLHGSHPLAVLGERWRSAQEFFRDLGIGLLFLVVTIVFTSTLGAHGSAADRAVQFLLPETKDRDGSLARTFAHGRHLRRGRLPWLSAKAIHCDDENCSGWHHPFRTRIRPGAFLPGSSDVL